ncbi:MAG: GDSL-type esterase/lipase family protein [Leptolyngbyaceae cyanobacterium bins.59]|nr:GDSL-type esterase/lipase family protein [Leptolyngbyaceae cyanobacterium bins.59]
MSGLSLLAASLLVAVPATDTSHPQALPDPNPVPETAENPGTQIAQKLVDLPSLEAIEPARPEFSHSEENRPSVELLADETLDQPTPEVGLESTSTLSQVRERDPLMARLFPGIGFSQSILPQTTVPPIRPIGSVNKPSAPIAVRKMPGTSIAIAPSRSTRIRTPASFSRMLPSLSRVTPPEESKFPALQQPSLPTPSRRVVGPASGSQLFYQRLAALRFGRLHTRIAPDSYRTVWGRATVQPTYEQWQRLLAQEARSAARGKGSNRLGLLVGDSLSLWFPGGRLPTGQFWLNQGISGDTSGGILKRLPVLSQARPDTVYLMAGINDLRRGTGAETIVRNLHQIVRRLRQAHPNAQIVLQSILPTDLPTISNTQIRWINHQLETIAQREGITYLDLYSQFVDDRDRLNPALTTDGLHLNAEGYAVWQAALNQAETQLAMLRNQRQARRLVSQQP